MMRVLCDVVVGGDVGTSVVVVDSAVVEGTAVVVVGTLALVVGS
jgi:hypothetical protein